MAETLAAIGESRAARLTGDRRRQSELVKRSKAQLRTDRERVASELAWEVRMVSIETTSDLLGD